MRGGEETDGLPYFRERKALIHKSILTAPTSQFFHTTHSDSSYKFIDKTHFESIFLKLYFSNYVSQTMFESVF